MAASTRIYVVTRKGDEKRAADERAIEAAERARQQAAQAIATAAQAPAAAEPSPTPAPAPIASPASSSQAAAALLPPVKLADICARLGWTLTAAQVRALGVPTTTDKRTVLVAREQLPALQAALAERVRQAFSVRFAS